MKITTNSAEETFNAAYDFAQKLNNGDVITLDGDLGAGKTAFTSGLARGLGACERVVSPTFTIVNEYRSGRLPLFHFDVYRFESSDDLYDIGWEDYLNQDGICVVEWASITPDAFDMPHYCVKISKKLNVSDDCREIDIEFVGGVK